jgi:hypothetical protein
VACGLAVNYSRRIYPKEELRGGGRYPPRPCTYQSNSSTCIPYGITNIPAEALHTEADKLINHCARSRFCLRTRFSFSGQGRRVISAFLEVQSGGCPFCCFGHRRMIHPSEINSTFVQHIYTSRTESQYSNNFQRLSSGTSIHQPTTHKMSPTVNLAGHQVGQMGFGLMRESTSTSWQLASTDH